MTIMTAFVKEVFLPPGPGRDMHTWTWNWSYHLGLFSLMIMAAFWIALIVGILFLIRWLIASSRQRRRAIRSEDPALDILRARYARGEVSKEEFEQKRKDLGYG